jgi:hypothetical protein
MYKLFRYPDDEGPCIHIANFQTAEEVLACWNARPVDPDGQQHFLTENGKVIAVEASKSRKLVFI